MSSLNADLAADIRYTHRGLGVLGTSPWQYVQILSAFAAPATVAAYVTAPTCRRDSAARASLWLNAISASAAPVVVMTAVAARFHGVTLGFMAAMRQGLWWLLRYLWTNAHTSVIFWVPTLVLLNLFEWQRRDAPVDGWAGGRDGRLGAADRTCGPIRALAHAAGAILRGARTCPPRWRPSSRGA